MDRTAATGSPDAEAINLSERARVFLASALDEALGAKEAPGRCFRLVRSLNGRLQLAIGSPVEDDLKFVHEDRTILVVDARLGERLGHRTIDIEGRSLKRQSLVIT